MLTDKFEISLRYEETDLVIVVTEHNNKDVVTYDTVITAPEGYAKYYQIEQPLTMKYDPINGHLVFDSLQDLSDLEDLEYSLSNEITNRNL